MMFCEAEQYFSNVNYFEIRCMPHLRFGSINNYTALSVLKAIV